VGVGLVFAGTTTGFGAGGGAVLNCERFSEIFCSFPDGGGTFIFGNPTKINKNIKICNNKESTIPLNVLIMLSSV
jgi:hypothetical protein